MNPSRVDTAGADERLSTSRRSTAEPVDAAAAPRRRRGAREIAAASTRVGRRLGLGNTGGVVTSLVACLAPGVVVGFKTFKTAGFESGGVKV